MKKVSLLISTILVLAFVAPVLAENTQNEQLHGKIVVASPSGTGVKNTNEVKTRNTGEDTNLVVSTQKNEGTEGGSLNRSQTATEHMSAVASAVQQLLQTRTTGGIGDQVRQIAKDQNQTQTQIQQQLDKINSRGKIAKILFGSDLNAVKSLNQQLEQNQTRITLLQQLQTKLTNQSDVNMVQQAIDALTNEDTSLQDVITAQNQTKSLFGWLIKLFTK